MRKSRNNLAPKIHPPRKKRKLNWEALKKNTQFYPDAFLRERAEYFGVHIHAIEYALKQMNLTRKKSLLYPEKNHEKRIKYRRTLRKIVKDQRSESLVYRDESGFEYQSYRPYAYALRGQKTQGNRSGKHDLEPT